MEKKIFFIIALATVFAFLFQTNHHVYAGGGSDKTYKIKIKNNTKIKCKVRGAILSANKKPQYQHMPCEGKWIAPGKSIICEETYKGGVIESVFVIYFIDTRGGVCGDRKKKYRDSDYHVWELNYCDDKDKNCYRCFN